MPHRFWFVRHALVHPASLTSLYGTNDVPICEPTMLADAPRYAALAARLPYPARLVCTPLSRTQRTAAAIQRAGYPAQTPLLDAAFVEQNFGALQGLPISQFEARPVAGVNGALPEGDARHPHWPIHALEAPAGGESFDTMIGRVGAGLERLVASAKSEHTVIISHGGAIRAACAYALGLSAHQALCLAVDNISLTRLERNDHGWRVLSINEHLSTSAYETTDSASIAPTQNELEPTQGANS